MQLKGDSFYKNLGFAILAILLLAIVIGFYGQPLSTEESVGLSRVAQEIQAGNVEALTVEESELTVKLKDSDTELASQKEIRVSVTETMRNLGVTEAQLSAVDIAVEKPSGWAFWTVQLLPLLLPFLLLAGFLFFMMRGAQNMSNRAMTFGQAPSKDAQQVKPGKRTTFKDVAGNEEPKNELQEVVEFLKTPKKFQRLGARIPKGVLLVGPPGTGKTLMARAVAGEANVPFFSMSGSDFVEMFVGVGAARVRDIFKKVKRGAPAILFVDELDAVGRHRGAGLGGGHDEREQTLNQILVEMDGFEQTDNVIVLAATNRPDVLDPALLRPGRFDRQVVMELPDIEERAAIMKIHAVNVPLAESVNLRLIAERTPGFAGADLANLVNEAAILASRNDQSAVEQQDLIESIEKVMLGPEKRSKVFSKKEKKVTAYHEAGHAVVAYYMPNADPVRKISIIARGHAGGYTLKLPSEDKRLHTKGEFESDLAMMMGGLVAERITFEEQTTGASNDLQKATGLARSIVTDYGMSELGPMTFGQKDQYVFLGKELHESRNYSEETAAKIDAEVARFLTTAEEKAKTILTDNNDKLELVARTLIERETLEQEEFAKLMKGESLDDPGPAAAPEESGSFDEPKEETKPLVPPVPGQEGAIA